MRALKKQVSEAEAKLAKLQAQVSELDRAMFDPASAKPDLAKLAMGELSRRRGVLAADMEAAEAEWLGLSEALEAGANEAAQ